MASPQSFTPPSHHLSIKSLSPLWSTSPLRDRRESEGSSPLGLRRLSRSPQEILKKKAELDQRVGGRGVVDLVQEDSDEWFEMRIKLRLFYIQEIQNLRRRQELAASESSQIKVLEKEMEELRKQLDERLQLKGELMKKLMLIVQDQECFVNLAKASDQGTNNILTGLVTQVTLT